MVNTGELIVALLLVTTLPFWAHAGAIGGDKWRPAPIGALDNKLGRFITTKMNTILAINGLMFGLVFVFWRYAEHPYFLLPFLLATPTVVAQIVLAAASAHQSAKRR